MLRQRIKQAVFTLIFVLSATVFPLVMSQPAEAALTVCRGDPVLYLSNGTKLTFTVEFSIPASKILSVVYTVHAPAGFALKRVAYPLDALTGKESVVFKSDSKDSSYHVTVVAHTLAGTVGDMLVTGLNKKIIVTVTGKSTQPLSLALSSAK